MGGSDHDFANSIAINLSVSGENVYVTGVTYSSDFPTTPDAYDSSFNSGDAFVSRLDGNLETLLASTYLGGFSNEFGNSIAIDSGGNIYVAGEIISLDFPTTPGTYDASFNGSGYCGGDTFVSKLDGGLTNLLASTYLGGDLWDGGESIAIDTGGNIYTAGFTWTSDFPITPDAYDTSPNGSLDAFVSGNNDDLSSLLASTYLGGSSSDDAHSIATDTDGNIYVAGSTYSSNFPTTTGAYDISFNSDRRDDTFISKFDRNLSSGKVSYWKFDEGSGMIVGDSADGNNGAINGAVWATGIKRGGLSFDGDDFVEIPGLIGLSQNITISGWAKLISKDTGGAELISLGDYLGLRLDAASGVKGFYYDGTSWQSTNTGKFYAGTGWHHFVYVIDASNNSQNVYIDGVVMGSTAHTQSISYIGLGSNTFIGKHGNGVNNYDFNGLIDDVSVYNRALSNLEVQNLYNNGN